MKIKLVACIGTDSNISNPNLLYHFLEHYSKLGITDWSIKLHSSGNPQLNNLQVFEDILKTHHIPYSTWIGKYDDVRHVIMENVLIARHTPDDWFVSADLDEFTDFPCSIPEYLADLAQQGYNCVTGNMIDHTTANGELTQILRDELLTNQFPREISVESVDNDLGITYEVSEYAQVYREKKVAIKKPLQWWISRHDINQKTKSFVKESPEKLKIRHYPWDDLRLKRLQDRYTSRKSVKPIHYSEKEYMITQNNRSKIIEYLQKNGKFLLK